MSSISRHRPEIGIMTRPGSHNDTLIVDAVKMVAGEPFKVVSEALCQLR